MAGGAPTFSFIVLSYQSGDYLRGCLESLFAQAGDDYEVILTDNASGDGAPQAAVASFPTLKFVDNGANLGYAGGNNAAARTARGRWLCFINPDVVAEADWLKVMRAAIADFSQTRLFTSLQIDPVRPDHLDGAGDGMTAFGFPFRMGYGQARPEDLRVSEVFSPCGAAFVIEHSLFETLGGFDERFFLYCEDADLGYRARLRGEATLLIPEAVVGHVGSATLGARSDVALYHGYRNRIWLYAKNTPASVMALTIVPHIVFSLCVALKDVWKGRGSVVMRALRDALDGMGAVMRDRQYVQTTRSLSAGALLRQLTWNPRVILRRGLDLRRPK
ncbi:MAG: glycosyltransferase family 2 protein [Asticcacaulis sp.]